MRHEPVIKLSIILIVLLGIQAAGCKEETDKSPEETGGCTTAEDCDEGQVCNPDSGECEDERAPEGCTTAEDCDEGEVCNQDTGECEDEPIVSEECTDADQCEEGQICNLRTGECEDYPDTPAGRQMKWYIDVLNGLDITEQDYEERFSEEFRPVYTLEDYLAFVERDRRKHGTVTVTGFEASTIEYGLWVQFYSGGEDRWYRGGLVTTESEPYYINGTAGVPSPDLDPTYGPIADNEIGLVVQEPSGRGIRGIVTVELVNAASGESFAAPVVGEIDAKYHYVRLQIPVGEETVGVRVTSVRQEEVAYHFSPNFKPGSDLLSTHVFDRTALPFYLNHLSLEEVEGTGRIWGMLMHETQGGRWNFEAGNPYVGCAQVSTEPSDATVYYTGPPSYLPEVELTETDPIWPTFFMVNVEADEYTFVGEAGNSTTASAAIPVKGDVWTIVEVFFDAATTPENPTPAECIAAANDDD